MCVSTLNYKRARAKKQIYHDTSATVIETQNVTKLRLAFKIATKCTPSRRRRAWARKILAILYHRTISLERFSVVK